MLSTRVMAITTATLALTTSPISNMIVTSSASALTLTDICSKSATELLYTESLCSKEGSHPEWGWTEVSSPKNIVLSKPVTLHLTMSGLKVACATLWDGTASPKGKGEITIILTVSDEDKPIVCTVLESPLGLCEPGPIASPDSLPWLTELVAAGELLGSHSGGQNPGWSIKCKNGLEDICTREDMVLKVTNVEGMVKLTFNSAEKTHCTIGGEEAGAIEGSLFTEFEGDIGQRSM